MRKYRLNTLCLLLLLASTLAPPVYAQSTAKPDPPAASPEAAALSALPDSDAVIVLNFRRLLTEALPRLLPAKSGKEMEGVLTVVQLLFGTSVRQIDSVVMGFKEPQAISARVMPPFAVVVHGSFNSETVVDDVRRLIQEGSKRSAREEQYRGRRILVFDVEEVSSRRSKPLR